jgi:hypothetical protein
MRPRVRNFMSADFGLRSPTRINQLLASNLASYKEHIMAKKKVAKKGNGEAKAKAEPKEPAKKFGHDMRIVVASLPKDNWRREGTANHDRAKEVLAFMKKNPRATVADLIAATSYRRNDFEWDLEREVFKTASA